MSREIKFRAWDKEEKEYYYNAEHTYDFFCSGRGCCEESFGEVLNQPDRFIVEQYTGLKDKNGKEIYEGDIIKDTSDGDCLINAVFWCEKGGFWGVKPRSPFTDREWGWFIGREGIEVIGNIHENLELLGGEE